MNRKTLLVQIFDLILALLLLSAGACKPTPTLVTTLSPEEKEAREIAKQYLSAWESANYQEMCTYLEGCEPGRVKVFPIPTRSWMIERVETEDSEIVIQYSIEMPNLGCIIDAAAKKDSAQQAESLRGTDTYERWEDTLRLAKENGDYKIASSRETPRASNRIFSFLQTIQIMTMTIPAGADRILMGLALYQTEFDVPEGPAMDEIVAKAAKDSEHCR